MAVSAAKGLMMEIKLLQDWKFIREDACEAFNRNYDDSGWQDVTVPHDWSVAFPFSREYSSGTGYLPGGIGWYRTKFSISEEAKTALLVFDGVYKNAQVWINGYYLGKRPNGYAEFSYDISPFIRLEDENILCVKVTHTDIADSRWFTGSGIYRKVKLITYSGAYIPDRSVVFRYDGEYAYISARIIGYTDKYVTVSLGEEHFHIHNQEEIDLRVKIDNPKLWSCDEPNLYPLEFREDGLLLCEPLRVGLRTFNFDADKGFSLNGVPMKIKGVCVHHDAGCLGAAVWCDVWHRRLTKLKACGCNAIRMSHNPHMPELYDLCDEMGFIVMDEAFDEWEGCKNKWVRGHNVYPPAHQGYYEDFPEWHERDLEAMVKRGRNHPSILMWSVGNEIDYPNDPYAHPLFQSIRGNNDANKPAQEMMYSKDKPCTDRLVTVAKRLVEIVKKHDATRPVLTAVSFPELSAQIGFYEPFDIIGYNYKEHLYEQDHKLFPKLPFLGSENRHSEEAWRAVTDNEYISGQFLWTGIDYLGEARGWPARGSRSGLLDTAGYEKPQYYARKTLWTGEDANPPSDEFSTASKIDLSLWPVSTNEGKYKLYQAEVRILDKNGILCTDNAALLNYTVANGRLLGIENGEQADLTEYSAPYRRVYRGRAIAYVLVEASDSASGASLTVSGEGFTDEIIKI